jgi:hypothetical protein
MKEIRKVYNKFEEVHHHYHDINRNYHHSDYFNFSFNAFLQSCKALLNQLDSVFNNSLYKHKYKQIKTKYYEGDKFKVITDFRNIISHEKDLEFTNHISLCLHNGKEIRDEIPIRINNFIDSDSTIKLLIKVDNPLYNWILTDEDFYLVLHVNRIIKNTNTCPLEDVRESLLYLSDFIHDLFLLTGDCFRKKNSFSLFCPPLTNNVKYKFYNKNSKGKILFIQ